MERNLTLEKLARISSPDYRLKVEHRYTKFVELLDRVEEILLADGDPNKELEELSIKAIDPWCHNTSCEYCAWKKAVPDPSNSTPCVYIKVNGFTLDEIQEFPGIDLDDYTDGLEITLDMEDHTKEELLDGVDGIRAYALGMLDVAKNYPLWGEEYQSTEDNEEEDE